MNREPDLARMRAEVTSKGGTTEAALAMFDLRGLGSHRRRCTGSGCARSQELAEQFGTALVQRLHKGLQCQPSISSSSSLFGLYQIVLLLRLLMQLVRADFRNPLARAIVQLTDPLILPSAPRCCRLSSESIPHRWWRSLGHAAEDHREPLAAAGLSASRRLIAAARAAARVAAARAADLSICHHSQCDTVVCCPGELLAGAVAPHVDLRAGAATDPPLDSLRRRPRSVAPVGMHRDSGAAASCIR